MAAPAITDVMTALEMALEGIAGLRVADVVPDQMTPPVAFVGVPEIAEYHSTFGPGFFTLSPTITVLVSAALDRIGQRKLASYADPASTTSIRRAVEADMTLGGVVSQAWVQDFRPLGLEEVNAIGYYGGIFTVTVVAQGS
jgi:hypothetical protein